MAEYNYQKNLKLWRLGSFGFKTPDKISYYYLKDYIGNIRVTVNEQGEIVTKDDYYPFGLRMLERSVNPDLSGPGLSYNNGNENDRLKFQSKRLQDYGNWETYYFGRRDYDPELGRWFVVDPAKQFASPYVFCGNNAIINFDEDGRIAWFVPIIVGALVGGTSGAIIAEKNGVDWWKGAITGAFIGAGIGALAAPAVGATGMYTTTATGTKIATEGWGLATSIINGANINMAFAALGGANGEELYKFGMVGAASGAFTATGGFGLAKKGFLGRLAFQGVGTAGRSIGNNWAAGEDPFSKVSVGFGPVNLTLGKGQKLLQWENNIGNILTNGLGVANLLTGGEMGFNWKHLTFKYGGGMMEKVYDHFGTAATGAHSVLGDYLKDSDPLLGHELHHIWQSRSLGDSFIWHYFFQGVNAVTLGAGFFYKANYFEKQAYDKIWGY